MLVFVLYVLALEMPVVSGSDETGLKFGNDGYSLISFQPDMASLSEKFTFCLWIRTKTSESTYQIPFAYEQDELFIDSIKSGNRNRYRLFGSTGHVSSEHIPEMGTWYQYCGTWSLASRTFRAYVNGALAGTLITSAGRKLKTGGTFVLGDYLDSVASGRATGSCDFGGEMYNLNLFSKELTGTEIAALSADGLCTPLPDQLDEYRVIRWEEVLELTRKGTVQDIQIRCGDFETELEKTQRLLQEAISEKEELQSSLRSTQVELLEVKGQRDSAIEELQEVKETMLTNENELNNIKTELRNVSLKLNGTKTELVNARIELGESNIAFENSRLELNETKIVLESSRLELDETKSVLESSQLELNETQSVLESSILKLNETKSSLESSRLELNESQIELENTELELKTALEKECELQKGHLTKWDVLYSCPFYNKVFTRRLHKQLRTTWGSPTRRLLGMKITDKVIALIKDLDEDNSCVDG
ncbi:uncharacterized protein LOC134812682 [Bolinopsis microptera]|uniref:uncharacterized protein LOC134812682 n=1 Tax=Bolinopsis microptera TaxID=2820187 RepID=UPI003079CAD3